MLHVTIIPFATVLLKLKRTPGIFLVGFMGSGKSTVGRALADELGWGFTDLDEEIERAEGATIAEIFDQRGEDEFRRLEAEGLARCVKSIKAGRPQVVSLGGGAFLSEDNFNLVLHNGVSIWLDCPFEIIERRVAEASHRPLARDPYGLKQLFEARRDGYARAEYRIDARSDDSQDAISQILALSIL